MLRHLVNVVVNALAGCLALNVFKCTGLINGYVRCRYINGIPRILDLIRKSDDLRSKQSPSDGSQTVASTSGSLTHSQSWQVEPGRQSRRLLHSQRGTEIFLVFTDIQFNDDSFMINKPIEVLWPRIFNLHRN